MNHPQKHHRIESQGIPLHQNPPKSHHTSKNPEKSLLITMNSHSIPRNISPNIPKPLHPPGVRLSRSTFLLPLLLSGAQVVTKMGVVNSVISPFGDDIYQQTSTNYILVVLGGLISGFVRVMQGYNPFSLLPNTPQMVN